MFEVEAAITNSSRTEWDLGRFSPGTGHTATDFVVGSNYWRTHVGQAAFIQLLLSVSVRLRSEGQLLLSTCLAQCTRQQRRDLTARVAPEYALKIDTYCTVNYKWTMQTPARAQRPKMVRTCDPLQTFNAFSSTNVTFGELYSMRSILQHAAACVVRRTPATLVLHLASSCHRTALSRRRRRLALLRE